MDQLVSLISIILIIIHGSLLYILLFVKEKNINYKFSPKITILIPAHNEEEIIDKTIQALLDDNYPNQKEIIILNDGSTDKTSKIVSRYSKKNPLVKLINLKHKGKSGAINTGIKRAKNDFIIILDADSLVQKNSISEIIKPLKDKKVGASAGYIRAIKNKNPLTWFQDFEYIISSGWRYLCTKINGNTIVPGFSAFRKKVLMEMGGFSSETLSEDFDIVVNMKKFGYETRTTKAAVMFTDVPKNFKSLIKQRIRWSRGTIQVLKKNFKFLFSRKSEVMGVYSIPTIFYWYVHAMLFVPLTFYQIVYYFYDSGMVNNPFCFSTLLYLFKWFSVYGMIDLTKNVILGIYPLTFVLFLVIFSFYLSFIYTISLFLKYKKPDLKDFFVYFFFPPYNIFNLSIMFGSMGYEIFSRKSHNIWTKN
jgi:cellulose synthase/poly-beta-1,6-N-acetylglucosamine synthase-like glycosyltransferase